MVPIEETPSAEQISRRTEPEEELASSRFDQSRDGHIRRSPTVELITDQTITDQITEKTEDLQHPTHLIHHREVTNEDHTKRAALFI